MPIITPKIDTDIKAPMPSYSPNEAALKAFLGGLSNSAEMAKSDQDRALRMLLFAQGNKEKEKLQGDRIAAENQRQKERLSDQKTRQDERMADKQGARTETYVKQASDELSKLSGYTQLFKELEDKTNVDGKGGIITNPNAKLRSGGKLASAAPSWALGAASLAPSITGVDNDTVEERKTIDRLRNQYLKDMSGVRIPKDAVAREQAAMGMMASGDPELLAKGIRSLAAGHRARLGLIMNTKDKDAQDALVERLGHNPMDDIGNVYEEPPTYQQPPKEHPQGIIPGAVNTLSDLFGKKPPAQEVAPQMSLSRKPQALMPAATNPNMNQPNLMGDDSDPTSGDDMGRIGPPAAPQSKGALSPAEQSELDMLRKHLGGK